MLKCDMAYAEDAVDVLKHHTSTGSALHGVLHAGGVLQDASLPRQTAEGDTESFCTKSEGRSCFAATCSKNSPSGSILLLLDRIHLWQPSQTNYAAANGVLDAWACLQQSAGLTTGAINWGAWAGAGMASRAGVERNGKDGVRSYSSKSRRSSLGSFLIQLDRGSADKITVGSVFLWSRMSDHRKCAQRWQMKQENLFSDLLLKQGRECNSGPPSQP
eukprot:jgi/Botrbrau1/19843/Bobra.0124s0079.1